MMVGAKVIDAFGQEQTVEMEQYYWLFLDWLAEDQEIDTKKFIVDCDLARGEYSLAAAMRKSLHHELIRREDAREPIPAWSEGVNEDPYEDEIPHADTGTA